MKYDNPLVTKQPWFKEINTKDGDLLILYKVLDSIKEGGRAVIAVPGRVLFSNHPSYEKLRKNSRRLSS
jgi:type I restriction-modification system DNA methylase subunit